MNPPGEPFPDIEVATQTVNQRAYDRLCELIAGGRLRFGERLDERELAERMKISRTPIRDAVGRLAAEGVVERRPYLGNFVRSFTPTQIQDLYEVRIELEGLAVRQAVARASAQQVDELAAIIAACHEAYEQADLDRFEALDQRFHDHIARISNNQTLFEVLQSLRLQIRLVRHYANEMPSQAAKTLDERNGILDAFRNRDARSAAKWMRRHIRGSQLAFSQRVDHLGDGSASS